MILTYTSGTTGPPKGAMISQANVMFMMATMTGSYTVFDTDEQLGFLPLAHVAGRIFYTFLGITVASVVNLVESPETLVQDLQEVSPTVHFAVPRVWEKQFFRGADHAERVDRHRAPGLQRRHGGRRAPRALPQGGPACAVAAAAVLLLPGAAGTEERAPDAGHRLLPLAFHRRSAHRARSHRLVLGARQAPCTRCTDKPSAPA